MNSDNKSLIVRKSNELIEARYKLSLREQRLIVLLASQIHPDDKDFKSYQIRVADFIKLFNLSGCNATYTEVQEAAKELVGKRLDLSKNGKEIYTTWLSYVEYIPGSGIVHLEFHSSLKPYLIQLKERFTQYDLSYIVDFSSQYSIRFYELFKMDAFKAKNGFFDKIFVISELRLTLGLNDNEYQDFKDFRRRTIEPAIKEINEKTDLKIENVQYGKTGRKITNVTFTVAILSKELAVQQQAKLEIVQDKVEEERHLIIQQLIDLGFSEAIAKKCKSKYGVKHIERNIAYTLAKKQDGAIKDIPAYLNKAIESDLGRAWDIKQQQEAEKKQEQVKIAKTKKAEEEKVKENYAKALETFLALPEEQQILIKAEFMNHSDMVVVAKMKEYENKGRHFLDSAMVVGVFKSFLVKQKGF